jgi:hypothetical protein
MAPSKLELKLRENQCRRLLTDANCQKFNRLTGGALHLKDRYGEINSIERTVYELNGQSHEICRREIISKETSLESVDPSVFDCLNEIRKIFIPNGFFSLSNYSYACGLFKFNGLADVRILKGILCFDSEDVTIYSQTFQPLVTIDYNLDTLEIELVWYFQEPMVGV